MGTPLLRPPLLSAGPLELGDRSACHHRSASREIRSSYGTFQEQAQPFQSAPWAPTRAGMCEAEHKTYLSLLRVSSVLSSLPPGRRHWSGAGGLPFWCPAARASRGPQGTVSWEAGSLSGPCCAEAQPCRATVAAWAGTSLPEAAGSLQGHLPARQKTVTGAKPRRRSRWAGSALPQRRGPGQPCPYSDPAPGVWIEGQARMSKLRLGPGADGAPGLEIPGWALQDGRGGYRGSSPSAWNPQRTGGV